MEPLSNKSILQAKTKTGLTILLEYTAVRRPGGEQKLLIEKLDQVTN